jgi:hypothetical protein
MQHCMRYAALAVLASASVSSCVCDAPRNAPHDAPLGAAQEPGVHHGTVDSTDPLTFANQLVREHPSPCATACYTAWAGICADATTCDARDARPADVTTCTNQRLTCEAIWSATRVFHGIARCTRQCEEDE